MTELRSIIVGLRTRHPDWTEKRAMEMGIAILTLRNEKRLNGSTAPDVQKQHGEPPEVT